MYSTARKSLLLGGESHCVKTTVQPVKFQPAVLQPVILQPVKSQTEKPQPQYPANLLDAKWDTVKYSNSADPAFWGPAFWFSLHNGAARYPKDASHHCIQKMKGFIQGMPYIIPCENCSEHCRAYIDSKQSLLDDICGSREKLFNFFVDLHNIVNKRYGKPTMSYKDAFDLYTKPCSVSKFTYA